VVAAQLQVTENEKELQAVTEALEEYQ